MNSQENPKLLETYLKEYDSLKEEQRHRIGFRDNMLYVTLGAVGAVCAFALADPAHYFALLVVPWICVVLGWTYLVNDQKVSAIGEYIRVTIEPRIKEETKASVERVFGWEEAHRADPWRYKRKALQLVVDELAFVASGLVILATFVAWSPSLSPMTIVFVSVEAFVLIALGVLVYLHADLRVGA